HQTGARCQGPSAPRGPRLAAPARPRVQSTWARFLRSRARGPHVLTRRLSLKLLAPTVLVSLTLVATCSGGVLYVSHLHLDIARVFKEHVDSTLAAQELEATVKEMVRLLQDDRSPPEAKAELLEARHRLARAQLEGVWALANLERERELV